MNRRHVAALCEPGNRQTEFDKSTIISQIAAVLHEGQALPFHLQLRTCRKRRALTAQAERLFGQINGWHQTRETFRICDIGRQGGEFLATDTAMFDHCLWYRARGRCAAIVAQPYPPVQGGAAHGLASLHGVACHVPRHAFASLHYPGRTRIFVFTPLEHQIVWLPEQIDGGSDGKYF